jgi:phosphoribosylformylglycinamidine synthase
MSLRIGVISFPGSNCEYDVLEALVGLGADAEIVWHQAHTLVGVDAVVIPGGFAHGDYLRCGAIARFSPIMEAVVAFASAGGPVLGICNGFQVLTEAGLLPGALVRNAGLRFLCETATLEVSNTTSILTAQSSVGDLVRLPINHGEGNYTCDRQTLDLLESREQVVLRYVNNPNGSMHDIAGVQNEAGNVVGLMPHPERAFDELFGSGDGRNLLDSVVGWTERSVSSAALSGTDR